MSTNRIFARLAVPVLLSFMLSGPTLAADADQNTESDDNVLEDMTVVRTAAGTSIRGVAPIGSSMIELSREGMDRSPAMSTIDILRETRQVFTLGVNDTHRNGSGGGFDPQGANPVGRLISPGASKQF